MPSPIHALLLEAMRHKRQIVCTYQGHRREICPIMLGRTGLEEKVLVFQSGGSTSRGPMPPSGEWKCFRVSEIQDPVLQEGRWHAGTDHSAASTCMKMVEYDINPNSPYNPVFQL